MLWLCLHLPQLPLSALGSFWPDTVACTSKQARGGQAGPASVTTVAATTSIAMRVADAPVVDQHGPHRWLITGTDQVRAGTPLAQALVIEPALRVRPRRPDAEHIALRSLAYAAYGYGQPVCAEIQDLHEPGRLPRALLWVEVGSSLTLFGGLDALRDALCSALVELGHAAQIGIAPTRAAAALLACADTVSCDSGWVPARECLNGTPAYIPTGVREAQDRPAPAPTSLRSGTVSRACSAHSDPVFDLHALRARIEVLPIHQLHWPGEVLHALHGVGFRCLRDLLAVPREAFSQRFGAQYRLALDHLLGDAPEPFEAIVPPESFRRRFELGAEIEDTERLQFPLKRLCTELQGYLRARDRGLRGVTLCVLHANARETRIHAQFVDPHRDAKRIFDALHERLERDGLPLPARELVLIAEDFAEASVPQSDLFDPRAAHEQAWAAALERIRGRLGESKAWSVQAIEDHRPECSVGRGVAGERAASFQPAEQDRLRPALLLPEPWIMPAPGLPPETCFERIESGWWDGQDIQREYTTLDINGARAWVFRDLATRCWYLHGWFA